MAGDACEARAGTRGGDCRSLPTIAGDVARPFQLQRQGRVPARAVGAARRTVRLRLHGDGAQRRRHRRAARRPPLGHHRCHRPCRGGSRPGGSRAPAAAQARRVVRVHELDAHRHPARHDAGHLLLHDRGRVSVRRAGRAVLAGPPGRAALTVFGRGSDAWDLPALLNAADPRAPRAERHLWLVRLMEWLRHRPTRAEAASGTTPVPVLRLKQLLNVLDNNPEYRERVEATTAAFWRDIRSAGLFSDFGFGPRIALASEVWARLRERLLPRTPDTRELAELFPMLSEADDADWLRAVDDDLIARLGAPGWRGIDAAAD